MAIQRIRAGLIDLPKPYWDPTLRRLILNENPLNPDAQAEAGGT